MNPRITYLNNFTPVAIDMGVMAKDSMETVRRFKLYFRTYGEDEI